MPEQTTCPKCGAEARIRSIENAVMYRCGTWVWYWHGEDAAQSPECRIRELTAENERLRAELAKRTLSEGR